ncbi:protein phosphatase 2C domain-containing protein [Pengzhenrongella phosphoraccumulans]|uniref:protein phosphatase 2C domain-containing protein n=1 Tax=Pengzhenrongella phosphoraccumulans TaxID=3114394 RepID=UPI003891119A
MPDEQRHVFYETAADGYANSRAHPWQDRWIAGQSPNGCWLVVADGITGGVNGHWAAQSAVSVAASALASTDLLEPAVMNAVMAAQAAVAPWFVDAVGGTTLSIATLTFRRLVACTVGDSPVLADDDGQLRQLSPVLPTGGLRQWIGMQGVVDPWLDSWAVSGPRVVAVTSDGADGAGVLCGQRSASALVEEILTLHRSANGDDSTAAVARLVLPSASESSRGGSHAY